MEGLEKFKVSLDIIVRWGDMDALQHVNNAVYIKWNEHARIEYMMKLSQSLVDKNIGPILARQDCKYIYPVTFPDTVKIGIRVCERLDDRLIFETKIWSHQNNRIVALIHSTVMAYDLIKKEKTSIPSQWLEKIAGIEN